MTPPVPLPIVPGAATLPRRGGSAGDGHLQGLGLRCAAEGVISVDDGLEREAVAHELLRCELALGDQFEQHRRRGGAHQAHGDRDVLDPQILEFEFHRLAVHADIRHGPAGPDELGGHLEGRGHAHGLDRDVHAQAVGHGQHLVPPARIAAVDAVGGAEAPGLLDPVVIEVYGDDARGAVEPGGHHRRQAHRPGTDDGDDVAGLDAAVAHPDLEARGQDVGEHDRGLVADALGNLVQGTLGEGHADVLRLGAVDEVAEDPADAGGALVVETVRGQLLVAVGACAARGDAGDDHAVSHGERAHRLADLGDGPGTFVPQNPPVGHRRDVPLEDVQVGAADRGDVHPHDHVSGVDDFRVGYVLPRLLTRSVVYQCLHQMTSLSSLAGTSVGEDRSNTTMSSRTFGSSPVAAAASPTASRPYCRPKSRTSVTVSPGTRLAIRTWTSLSRLSGLVAVINFMTV